MFGGLLAFLGIYAGSAAKAAKDNYDMKKTTRTVDKDGNIHYMDRLCNDYINSERVKRVETTDRNGVKLYSTVGVNSSKVYDTSYGRGTQQLFEMSEREKQDAIERGKLAYMQYNPYFGRSVTTEIATGRTITCLFEGKDPETKEPFYKNGIFVLSARINMIGEIPLREIMGLILPRKSITNLKLCQVVILKYLAIKKWRGN